ncbi:hypothetical protein [Nonomuraea jabiensis]|uniref:hypothetical protein n=1 Tax=Nonomuraea jabiensis TaxID=882448 RepID=UPI003D70C072
MTTAPSFLFLPFKGTRSGVFPLTWGQHWVWNSIVARAPHFSDLSGSYVVEVPEGCDVFAVLDGVPRQMVLADGHLRVEVREVDSAAAEKAAAVVEVEFNHLPFTLPGLSLRAAVIASDGVPRFVVLCSFHMAMDCYGMVSVLDYFLSVLSGHSPDTAGHVPDELSHPVDRALAEQNDQGVRRSARGVEYWADELAKFPENPLPLADRRPESPRYQRSAMRSAVVRAASLQLAEVLGVSTASVILAMAASVLAGLSGNRTSGVILAVNHRYDPESMRYAGTLTQGVPVALHVSGLPPHTLISQCHRTGMLAALAGHCHPGDLAEMLSQTYGAEGAEERLACVANLDIPMTEGVTARNVPRITRADAERLLVESQYDHVSATPVENERLYLAAQGTALDFVISLRADTAVLTSAEIVDFLHQLERSLIDCLPDPVVMHHPATTAQPIEPRSSGHNHGVMP